MGGRDPNNKEMTSKIERFSVKNKIWETLKIEMPTELCGFCGILKDDMLHCIGGFGHKGMKMPHLSIKLKEIYLRNGGLLIFQNWFRLYGFINKEYSKELGQIVEEYAGIRNCLELSDYFGSFCVFFMANSPTRDMTPAFNRRLTWRWEGRRDLKK